MRERPTVRVLLIRPDKRLLLIRYEDPRVLPKFRHFWATVGGAIESGETIEQSALREIEEETGFLDVKLGPVVWYGEPVIPINDEPIQFREYYIVAHVDNAPMNHDKWTDLERNTIREMRWWTPPEIAASKDRIFPIVLADWLPEILEGKYPQEVRRIPDRRPGK
jgi:8-oxo-dGTP pyrophosphatase MutT (NUDIX family)